jgi:FtsZ-binding cell division protein ZapB
VIQIEKRTLTGCFGRGDINHNNRSLITENVNREKIKDDIIICQKSLKQLYHDCFDNALAEFNARQTRRDRKITNYQEHIRHSRQEKEFYEVLFQVGNRDDTGMESDMCRDAAEILADYARCFEERNPHMKLFNAVVHMDESTPHLHLDFVPVCDEARKNGMRVRNSLTGALRQQGHSGKGISNTITMDWLEKEKEFIGQLMRERGIEWVKLGTHEEHLSVKEYKLKKRQEEIEIAENILSQKEKKIVHASQKLDSIGEELSEKSQQLSDSENKLVAVQEKISSVEKDLEKKQEKVNDILNYLPDIDREDKIEKDYFNMSNEIDEYLKSGFSIMRNKDEIVNLIKKMSKIVKTAVDLVQKYSTTIFDLRENFSRCKKDNDEYHKRNNDLYNKNQKLSKENAALAESNEFLSDVLSLVEHSQPDLVNRSKTVVQDHKRQQEQALVYQQQQKRKRSYELE